MEPNSAPRESPVAAGERVELLDVLRGFAILGMFTVNATVDLPWGDTFREPGLGPLDQASVVLVEALSNGKFITIFSFLFGIGFFLQLERWREHGSPVGLLYGRRLAALFAIGTVAIVCGLGTHILVDYAMFGLVLLLFRVRSPRIFLIAAVPCFLIAFAAGSTEDFQKMAGPATVLTESSASAGADDAEDSVEAEGTRLYLEGSFLEIAKYRSGRIVNYFGSLGLRLYDLDLLGLMLLGGYVFRRGAVRLTISTLQTITLGDRVSLNHGSVSLISSICGM